MMEMPKGLTAASGIDALTHSLEAYASMLASDFTDGLALTSIKNIFKYLPVAYNDGSNEEAREKMANASTIAGMAFANAFLGICHSMAHKLGAFYHIPHGIANALLINYVIRFNATENPKKMGAFSQYKYPEAVQRYAEIASFVGLDGKTDDEKIKKLTAKIDELKESIGIKKSIKEYGVDEKDFISRLDEMTEQAFDDQCTGANPRYPLMEEMKEIYLNAYYGR
jgi:acetaldehyde dehydrogenase/alcohol dehydrogenase